MGTRAVIAASLVLAACSGPDPVVERVAVAASPVPGHTRVAVDLANRSGGHGQIEIVITLQPADAGARTGIAFVAERTHHHDGQQRAQLIADLETPPGVYAASVRARYPD